MFWGLGLALAVVLVDQLSKYYILHEVMGNWAVVAVAPFFNLVRAWNTGVSFSMFNNYGSLGVWILSLMAMLIVGFLLMWLKKEPNRLSQAALGMIIGGAVGNVIDRVRLGAVFDFLDFYVGDYHWPAFNLADSFICVGAGILILQSVVNCFRKKEA